jgi:hypothetical protein
MPDKDTLYDRAYYFALGLAAGSGKEPNYNEFAIDYVDWASIHPYGTITRFYHDVWSKKTDE